MKYYHGSSVLLQKGDLLLPPAETGRLQEEGRKKNLDKVFFTRDFGSAKIYAGRSKQRFGGTRVVYEVEPIDEIVCVNDRKGTSVYHLPKARIVGIVHLE